MKPTLLILAAGMGSRYGSLKQIDPLGPSGETIIDYSIYDAILAGFGKVVFVVRENFIDDFREVFSKKIKDRIQLDYVCQEIGNVPAGTSYSPERTKPWGTGHAVLMAAGKIHEPFAVINSDDFYGRGAYNALVQFYGDAFSGETENYCMVGYEIGKTLSEHGTVSRGLCRADGDSFLLEVTERTRIARTSSGVAYLDSNENPVIVDEQTPVSMNFWGFTPSFFSHLESGFREFIRTNAESKTVEFYIPTVVNDLLHRKRATVKILKSGDRWFGMTYREDRELVISKIREQIEKGIYPEDLWK